MCTACEIKPGGGEGGGGGGGGEAPSGIQSLSERGGGGRGGRKLVSKQVLIFWREKYILRVYGGIQLILI